MNAQPHTHLPRPAHKEPPAHAPNAALLIDFDNMTMGIRSDLHTELKRLLSSEIIRGKVAVQRAYADWRRYQQYVVPLAESSIDLIFAPAYGSSKKNATDIRLAVDALELVFTRPEIGTFILLSGDSDFSSLVIKLKEYGKYVIGVGIRESSSDLLIQNCDEYYSYNELAGLTKEGDVVRQRLDPWALVTEAMKQMTAHNDVMRSDRLKQVMQELDPDFDEKDLGFSRFSKFVLEAAHKNLLNLRKLDSGQYEISLPRDGATAPAASPRSGHREQREEELTPAERPAARGSFSLGDAFGLLKQALGRMGGSEQPVTADELRETMVEMKGSEAEPLEPGRFPKLLRQAHDAEIIDLSKQEGGQYAVRLRGNGPTADQADASEPGITSGSGTPVSSAPAPTPSSSAASPAASGAVPARSARFRKGSRGRVPISPPDIPRIGVVEVDPNFRPRIELIPVAPPAGPPADPPVSGGVSDEQGEVAPERPREHDETERRPSRRGRGGGRGGRGRGRGSAGSGDGGGGERGGRRGRRGGGGGGRSERERPSHDSDVNGREPAHSRQQNVASEVAPSAPSSPPVEGASEGEAGNESFWSKVKRGLIGGE